MKLTAIGEKAKNELIANGTKHCEGCGQENVLLATYI